MELALSETSMWAKGQFAEVQRSEVQQQGGAIKELREKAFSKFLELGIPTTGQEDWRYTNLTGIAETPFVLARRAANPDSLNALITPRVLPESEISGRIVILNGFVSQELSKRPKIAGLTLSNIGSEITESAARSLDEPFTALNYALMQDALTIHVGANVRIEKPLEVICVAAGETESSFPRLMIVAESGAEITVIERHLSVGKITFINSVTEFDVAPNSSISHVFLQQLGPEGSQVHTSMGRIARDGKFFSHVYHLGGKLVRNEIRPVFTGPNAECFLNGLTITGGTQHTDNFTVIDHAAPNCFSREHYKGIYAEKSAGVFCGTIIVRQQAQKTNAIQSNESLLLSSTATVETKPQLKIWADDVKCTHGATVGQLNEEALFYLRSRGIPAATAKKMLIEAFASELVEAFTNEPLKAQVQKLIEDRLHELV